MKRIWIGILVLPVVAGVCVWAADEITITALLKVDNGEFALQRNVSNHKVDQAGTSMDYHIQVIGTGTHEEVTVIADVSSNGVAWIRNLTTNTDRYVELGAEGASTNFLPILRLYATEFQLVRFNPTNSLYAKASAGDVNLEVWINED